MARTLLISLLVLGLAFVFAAAKKLPDYVKVCHRSDPQFDSCIIDSIESLRTRLGRGIPQLQVPGYEPLVIPGLHVDRSTDALEINALLENLKVFGGSKFIINSLKTDLATHGVEASITLPELRVSTDYDVNGRVLVVPLTGKGSLDGVFSNVKADLSITGKVIERKNKKYLQIAGLKSNIKVGDSKLDFKRPGKAGSPAQTLSTAATQFINENKSQVLELVKPIVEDTINELFTEIANRVFQAVPYDDLIPE